MKTKINYPIAVLTASLAFAGCEPSKQSDSAVPPTNVSAREVEKQIKEAADATRAYMTESKEQFIASAQEKLNKLDQQISELGAKTETLKDEAKAESGKALTALREQRAQLGQRFEELKHSSKEVWKGVKAGFEAAFAELEKGCQNAKSKFGG
jgi:BMFP domain-containing protein YqiC